jgi:hypothetical protein
MPQAKLFLHYAHLADAGQLHLASVQPGEEHLPIPEDLNFQETGSSLSEISLVKERLMVWLPDKMI